MSPVRQRVGSKTKRGPLELQKMRLHLHRRRLHPSYKAGRRSEANGKGLADPTSFHERGKRRVILLTTSRRPTTRIRTFCRDLARSIPNIVRINRGKLNLDGIAERALEFNADRVVIVDRWRSGPGKIELFQTGSEGLISVSPLMYVAGIRLQREFEGTKAKPIRSLTITTPPEKTAQVAKIAEFLSNFLNIPMSSMDEAVSGYSAAMHITVNASRRTQITFMLLPETVEVGPRVTLSHVVWETGK